MGRHRVDLTGAEIDRWIVLGPGEAPAHIICGKYRRQSWWACQCKCGTPKVVSTISLRGGSRSCGCLVREANRARARAKN